MTSSRVMVSREPGLGADVAVRGDCVDSQPASTATAKADEHHKMHRILKRCVMANFDSDSNAILYGHARSYCVLRRIVRAVGLRESWAAGRHPFRKHHQCEQQSLALDVAGEVVFDQVD